jgi:hypothetical protein
MMEFTNYYSCDYSCETLNALLSLKPPLLLQGWEGVSPHVGTHISDIMSFLFQRLLPPFGFSHASHHLGLRRGTFSSYGDPSIFPHSLSLSRHSHLYIIPVWSLEYTLVSSIRLSECFSLILCLGEILYSAPVPYLMHP